MPSLESTQAVGRTQLGEPSWWGLCREKYAAGITIDALAAEFKRKRRQIAFVVSEREHLKREHDRARIKSYHVPVMTKRTSHNTSIIAPRAPRKVKRIIADPETIRAAAEKFARGKMDRAQFMKVVDSGARS